MTRAQQIAIENHCRLAAETIRQLFANKMSRGLTRILTVNTGYE
jgi:hypothetical protein